MSKQIIGILLVAAAIILPFAKTNGLIPRPAPDNTPSVDIPAGMEDDLKQVAKEEATKWAGMIRGLAVFIQADGETTKPVLDSMDDVGQLIEAATAAPLEPMPGGVVIGKALGSRMDAIGQAGDPLDSSRRKKVVDLFEAAASVLGGA